MIRNQILYIILPLILILEIYGSQISFETDDQAVSTKSLLDTNSTLPTGPENYLSIIWKFLTGLFGWHDSAISHKVTQSGLSQDITSTQSSTGEANPPKFQNIKIAILDPTFTGGAYNNAFYDFYKKYDPIRQSFKNTTENIHLLTGIIPDHFVGNYNPWYEKLMLDRFNSILPGGHFTVIRDQDVDRGLLFAKNGTNNYSLLIMGHEEYVSQQEYDNFRYYVSNGGKIIFLDGNIFYAEVSYNTNKNSVTLVKGHGYEFDGKVAKKSIFERWANENSEWLGGNYYHSGILYPNKEVNFTNNPFDAKFEQEEEYVTNPHVRILLDYGISDPYHMIATYELKYGKGDVMVLGLYGEHIINHDKFLPFFDSLVKGMLSDDPSSYHYVIPTKL